MPLSMDSIAHDALSLPEYVISSWPGRVGRRLRAAYWKRRLGAMGAGCVIDVGVIIPRPEYVFLGDNVWIDSYVILQAGPTTEGPNTWTLPNPAYRGRVGELHVGSNTHIAPYCVLQGHAGLSIGKDSGVGSHSSFYTVSSHYRAPGQPESFDGEYDHVIKYSPLVPPDQQGYIASPIVMEDASGVAVGSVVLAGSVIGTYSWVVAGSLVRGHVPPGVIAGGNPATVLKQRFGAPITPPPAR